MNRVYRGDYIQGKFVPVVEGNGEVVSEDPGNMGEDPVVFPFEFSHADEAVNAARRSLRSWKRIPLSDRLNALSRYRDLLEKRKDVFAQLITSEIGKPLWESQWEVRDCLGLIDYLLSEKNLLKEEDPETIEENARAHVVYHPRGVIAITSHTDLPGYGPHRFIIPSLIQGNTVILKSSRYAPTVAQFLAQVSHESGLPAGVFNVIHGNYEVSRRLLSHPDVDGIFFAGSSEKALKIKKQIFNDFKKTIALETGGKNATVLWEDCNYSTALKETFFSAFASSGQRNRSTRQVLIHKSLFAKAVADFHKLSKRVTIGYGFDTPNPFMGPLISSESVDNYVRFQGIAVREGCEEVMRGKALEREQRGYYVSPSLHLVHTLPEKSVYETSEFFGPNLALYSIEDIDEAIDILNRGPYGLVTSLYSKSPDLLAPLTDDAKMGQVNWNLPTTFCSERVVHGGLKKSGSGRPLGRLTARQCSYPQTVIHGENPIQLPESLPGLE